MAVFEYFLDGQNIGEFKVSEKFRIGQGRHSDLTHQHKEISKKHCLINKKGQDLFIEDLGSLHGTWVNGERVVVHGPIRENDLIKVGPFKIKLQPIEIEKITQVASTSQSVLDSTANEVQSETKKPAYIPPSKELTEWRKNNSYAPCRENGSTKKELASYERCRSSQRNICSAE